jgi:hypothetical protein
MRTLSQLLACVIATKPNGLRALKVLLEIVCGMCA